MPRRPSSRFAAWIAFIAILVSMLPPAGARHAGVSGGDADYCSTVGTNSPAPALPSPADRGHRVCSHCDGCTGAGSDAALPAANSTFVARGAPSPAPLEREASLPTPADLIAAPPRGPPHSA